jgi:hypothetical protein
MSHKTEFSRDYAIPPEVLALVAEGVLADESWHNDACPHFVRELAPSTPTTDRVELSLWVEHPEPAERETGGKRFYVSVGVYGTGSQYGEATEDVADAVAIIRYLLNPTVDEMVRRMKAEILADVKAGRVPKGVESFSALHDYVDANTYGLSEALWEVMAAGKPDDEQQAVRDRLFDLMNPAMAQVDCWIKAGGILRERGGAA